MDYKHRPLLDKFHNYEKSDDYTNYELYNNSINSKQDMHRITIVSSSQINQDWLIFWISNRKRVCDVKQIMVTMWDNDQNATLQKEYHFNMDGAVDIDQPLLSL